LVNSAQQETPSVAFPTKNFYLSKAYNFRRSGVAYTSFFIILKEEFQNGKH